MSSGARQPGHADGFFAELMAAAAICWGLAVGSVIGSTFGRALAGALAGAVAACVVAFLAVLRVGGRRRATIGRGARTAVLIALPRGAVATWFALPA